MTIAFYHPHHAFLPEIEAYSDFFSRYGIQTMDGNAGEGNRRGVDLEWHFMGTDRSKKEKNTVTIHEYPSASVPPFRYWKDLFKRRFNRIPEYRLFLNAYTKDQFKFNDDVPFGFRDMGIFPYCSPEDPNREGKFFDFIYVGNLDRSRNIESLLRCFTKNDLGSCSLLILGAHWEQMAKQFRGSPNIQFKGPVPHREVGAFIRQSKYAINFIPPKEPFIRQTSTKFLEYANQKTPIISTEYRWVKEFTKQFGGNYFPLSNDLSNLSWPRVSQFTYSFSDLREWSWEKQIRRSGVLEFLQSRFASLRF